MAGGIALLWLGLCPSPRLTAACDGALLFAWPIRAGDFFEVTFTHSVNQSPITDVFEWTGDDLVVTKSRFKAFGAGVPVPSDGIGTEMIRVGEFYELIGIDKHMPNFTIMTQTVPDHRVTMGAHEAVLLDLVGSGKQVVIEVRQVSFLGALFNRPAF
jgi:hypothetical protein